MNEHDGEPVRGLPAGLPPGEAVLWQGTPDAALVVRRVLHARIVLAYFALLAVWSVAAGLNDGESAAAIAASCGRVAALAACVLALMAAFGWLVARTTMYSVTTRRVVLRIGIALSVTVQIPFARIGSADARLRADGSGDITLALLGRDRIAYLLLWPHARPWRFSRAEPALRSLRDAAGVAQILGRALAAAADQSPALVKRPSVSEPDTERFVPAAA